MIQSQQKPEPHTPTPDPRHAPQLAVPRSAGGRRCFIHWPDQSVEPVRYITQANREIAYRKVRMYARIIRIDAEIIDVPLSWVHWSAPGSLGS